MSGGGSKPGERRGGRKKGTPNKFTQGRKRAEQAAKVEIANARGTEPVALSEPPKFDAKTQMEQFAMVLTNMVAAEQRKGDKADLKWMRDVIDAGVRACAHLMPYQHRRLAPSGIDVEALLKNDGSLQVSISSSDRDL
jgi:hypothetical protein